MKSAVYLAALCAAAPLAAQNADNRFFRDTLPAYAGDAPLQVLEMETRTAAPILLSRHPDGGAAVARLGENEAVQVVLADAQGHFLVKTARGLTGWAQPADGVAPTRFDHLKLRVLQIDGEAAYTLYYDPALGKDIDAKQADPEDSGVVWHDVLATAFAEGGKGHTVRCAAGVANDITFCLFLQDGAESDPASLSGNLFYLPGDGFVYSEYRDSGASYYRHYSKWQWADGQFVEIEQPYRYIGADGTATGTLTLNRRADGGGTVGTVQRGGKVRVIVADPHQPCPQEYSLADGMICNSATVLVRDENGQTGWVRIRYEDGSDNPPATIESKALSGLAG